MDELLSFEHGAIQEEQLEPDDQADYKFAVTNNCDCIRLIDIALTLGFDQHHGTGIEVTPPPPFTLEPGERKEVVARITTTAAAPGLKQMFVQDAQIGSVIAAVPPTVGTPVLQFEVAPD